MKKYKHIIAGGGMTADAAVKGIREVDGTGEVLIIGAEQDPPYKRPPLTKDLWTGKKTVDDIWCGSEAKGADVLAGTRVTAIDPDSRRITTGDGEEYQYEKLLLATGGTPRSLPMDGASVMYFRTLSDYRGLRQLTDKGNHFTVFGAGFIGSEIAAAMRMNEKEVTMVFPESGIAGLMLPLEFARRLTEYYKEKGVTVMSGCKPSAINEARERYSVRVENGRTVEADAVVAGLGIVPETALAEDTGLKVDNGIVVDEQLRTSRPDIFAAGDVANFHNPILKGRLRVEHEDNALKMGKAAGRNMAGEEEPYRHLPFFYSDLFDAGYEAVGETRSALNTFCTVDDVEGKGGIFYMKDGRVRGVVFWNIFGKLEAGLELIAAPGPHTEDGIRAWAKERLAAD
ncbi:MAG: FAD/NAD(P)-binding oxidoreductase [Kiritimatiellia bacterium]